MADDIDENNITWDDDPKFFIFNEYVAGKTKMHVKRLDLKNWVMIDNTYRDQMRVRREIMQEKRKDFFMSRETSETSECKWELFEMLTSYLPDRFPDKFGLHSGYIHNKVLNEEISTLRSDSEDPLIRIGKLTQEDWIIMEWDEERNKYVLTAGLLCFPSGWWLSEKFDQQITDIHRPVKPFLDFLDTMVQSMLKKMKPENPIWRANWGVYNDLKGVLDLYAPPSGVKGVVSVFDENKTGVEMMLREEYQTLRRLPRTKCIVFSIRYYQRYLKDFETLPLNDCIGLLNAIEGLSDDMKEYKGVKYWGEATTSYLRHIISKRQRNGFLGRLKCYLHTQKFLIIPMVLAIGSFFIMKKISFDSH